MVIKIGITGGIGSGKSVVCHLLELLGIPVYISDIETKRLMGEDFQIRTNLINLLGDKVYDGGTLNKSFLASYLFETPQHAKQINCIVHPQVRNDFRRWVSEQTKVPFVAMESAILCEAGFRDEVDVVVMIYAPLHVRVIRAMQRDSASYAQIEQRIRNQMDDEEKRRLADFVIVNDGKTPLIPQVLELITSLSKNNVYLCHPNK